MIKIKGHCDLSISSNFDFKKLSFIKKCGYDTIAINTVVDEAAFQPQKKKSKGEIRDKTDVIPDTVNLTEDHMADGLRVLNRLTIEFSDSNVTHKMNQSENLKKYDLVAAIPKTAAAFQYACGYMDIDIISFQPEAKIPFKLTRKLYRQAVDRGIFFELMYVPAIRDSTSRKNIINTAHNYHSVGKSKNILITSWCEEPIQLRGPYDIINLGLIFGLNANQCKDVLSNNARRAILKGDSRRRGKAFLYISDNTPDEADKIESDEDVEPEIKKLKM